MTLEQQIMIARKNMGFTQKDLAEFLGISTNHISNIERGVSNPKIETLKKISKVLNVNFIIGW